MNEIIKLIPLFLATLGLAIASFSKNKNKKNWLIVAFVIWITMFFLTLLILGAIKIS
ncbi:hypothetical protein J4402_00080 [Candidatus Pacearchaeota archaeon]|nr:hypothetical protein [Candidatus Pacearchaeota archaeon]